MSVRKHRRSRPAFRRPSLRTVLICGGYAALSLLMVRNGLGFVLAANAPELAVRIDDSNGRALAINATKLLLREDISATVKEAAHLSRKALRADPINAEAARNMGVEAVFEERADVANRWMTLSSRISRRDIVTQAMIFSNAAQNNKPGLTVQSADILMRQSAEAREGVIKNLIQKMADPAYIPPLLYAMSHNPTWRSTFLAAMGGQAKPISHATEILMALAKTATPPTSGEVAPYLARLEGQVDAATLWQQWVALGGRKYTSQLIRDSEMDGLDAPLPYVWRLNANDEVISEFAVRPMGKGNALYLSYDGRRMTNFAQQKLNLEPGPYFLLLEALGEQEKAVAPLYAAIRCGSISTGQVIAKLTLKVSQDGWSKSAFRFDVPQGCAGQYIWFGTDRTPTGEGASYWIDNVRIVRARR